MAEIQVTIDTDNIEVPTDPAVCEVYNGVCSMRQENGFCPLHEKLSRLQQQLDMLMESKACEESCEMED